MAYGLLQEPERNDWRLWLRAMGVEDDLAQRERPGSPTTPLPVCAAETGQGTALVMGRSMPAPRSPAAWSRPRASLAEPLRLLRGEALSQERRNERPSPLFLRPAARAGRRRGVKPPRGRVRRAAGSLTSPPNRFELRRFAAAQSEYRWQATKVATLAGQFALQGAPRRAACTT